MRAAAYQLGGYEVSVGGYGTKRGGTEPQRFPTRLTPALANTDVESIWPTSTSRPVHVIVAQVLQRPADQAAIKNHTCDKAAVGVRGEKKE